MQQLLAGGTGYDSPSSLAETVTIVVPRPPQISSPEKPLQRKPTTISVPYFCVGVGVGVALLLLVYLFLAMVLLVV